MPNHFADHAVPGGRFPAHHIDDHGKEHPTGYRLGFMRPGTPHEGVPVILSTRADSQLLLFPVDKDLHILDVRGFFEADRVDAQTPIREGYGGLIVMGIVFAPGNLETIVAEFRVILCFIGFNMAALSRSGCFGFLHRVRPVHQGREQIIHAHSILRIVSTISLMPCCRADSVEGLISLSV